jgi:hypothetical protein
MIISYNIGLEQHMELLVIWDRSRKVVFHVTQDECESEITRLQHVAPVGQLIWTTRAQLDEELNMFLNQNRLYYNYDAKYEQKARVISSTSDLASWSVILSLPHRRLMPPIHHPHRK